MQSRKERFIEAWKTVFDVEEVKDDDNFFEAGGDSLKGVQLLGCLAEKGLKLDMLKIYTQPTVEEMVEVLEEMDPVEIPSEVFTGQVSGEALEKYLQDPSVRKAMADFGIREEDVREKLELSSEAKAEEKQETSKEQSAGAVPPSGIPLNAGSLPSGMVWGIPAQPGTDQPQGYFIPVQLMLYAVPVTSPEGNAQPPFPGAIPVSLMACPVNWQGTDGGNEPPKDKE